MLTTLGALIGGALGGLASALAVLKSFPMVPQGHKGVLMRAGKAVRRRFGKHRGRIPIRSAGLMRGVPGLHGAQTLHVRERPVDCDAQVIRLQDGSAYTTATTVTFNVPDEGVEDALFRWDDLDRQVRLRLSAVTLRCVQQLQQAISAEDIAATIAECLQAELIEDGFQVVIIKLVVNRFEPTATTQETDQLERQLMAKAKAARILLDLGQDEPLPPWLVAAIMGGVAVPANAPQANGHSLTNGHQLLP